MTDNGHITQREDFDRWWEIFHKHGGLDHKDVCLTKEEWKFIHALVEGLALDAGDLGIEADMWERCLNSIDRPPISWYLSIENRVLWIFNTIHRGLCKLIRCY